MVRAGTLTRKSSCSAYDGISYRALDKSGPHRRFSLEQTEGYRSRQTVLFPGDEAAWRPKGAIKRRVNASQHFRSFWGAWRTIAGYEAVHMIRKGQCDGHRVRFVAPLRS